MRVCRSSAEHDDATEPKFVACREKKDLHLNWNSVKVLGVMRMKKRRIKR